MTAVWSYTHDCEKYVPSPRIDTPTRLLEGRRQVCPCGGFIAPNADDLARHQTREGCT